MVAAAPVSIYIRILLVSASGKATFLIEIIIVVVWCEMNKSERTKKKRNILELMRARRNAADDEKSAMARTSASNNLQVSLRRQKVASQMRMERKRKKIVYILKLIIRSKEPRGVGLGCAYNIYN